MLPSIPLPKQPVSHPTASSSSSSKETNHSARKTQAVAKRAIESPRAQSSSRAEETLRSLRPQLSDLLQNLHAVQAHLQKYELELQNDSRDVTKNIEGVEKMLSSLPSSKRVRVEPPSDEETEEPRSPQTRSRKKSASDDNYYSIHEAAAKLNVLPHKIYYAKYRGYINTSGANDKKPFHINDIKEYAERHLSTEARKKIKFHS